MNCSYDRVLLSCPLVLKDQLGYRLSLHPLPRRIVSLVPSQTELLCALGLCSRLVGRTKFCIHPSEALAVVPKVGGTKRIQTAAILALAPDLVVANKEENERHTIEALRVQGLRVYVSDVATLTDAYEMMTALGRLCGCRLAAVSLCEQIAVRFASLRNRYMGRRVLYLIWHRPWMAAGRDTFIDYILGWMGCENVVEASRYPQLNAAQLSALAPDDVLFSSEPFPFRSRHFKEIMPQFPHARPLLVDGTYFSWYGSRLLAAAPYLSSCFHIPAESSRGGGSGG